MEKQWIQWNNSSHGVFLSHSLGGLESRKLFVVRVLVLVLVVTSLLGLHSPVYQNFLNQNCSLLSSSILVCQHSDK